MYPLTVWFAILVIPAACGGRPGKGCNVFTKNQYVEFGSDVHIMCESSCIRGNSYWTMNNIPIDDSLSVTVNSSYTVLFLRNFTGQSDTFQCHDSNTHHIVGGTTLKAYTKPSRISCTLQHENLSGTLPDLFTCHWEHKMKTLLKITYTVYSSRNGSGYCTSGFTSCISRNIPPLDRNVSVMVRANTAAWEVDSESYEFHPFRIWKINPPKTQVTPFSTYLLVELRHLTVPGKRFIHCQVGYNKSLSGGTPQVLNKTMTPADVKGNVIIEEVESCTNYTVSARCALEEAPWSDWSPKRMVLSEVDKSTVKLNLWRKITELGGNGFRKVHALWKEIPPSCRGVLNHTIKPAAYKKHTLLLDRAPHSAVSCSLSYCDVDVDRHAHEITLTVFQNGSLLQNESVYVPAVGESLPEVSHIQVSTFDGKILVSWKAPNQHVNGFVVDWTHDGVTYFWKESKYTNTTLDDVQDFAKYNITITPLFDGKTGAETKILHICSREGVPEKIHITDVHTKDKSALVSWNIESQRECRGQVVNYTVFYRTEDLPQLYVSVNGTTHETVLEDLRPNSKYRVYLIAMTENGNISSSVTHFNTKRFDPSLIPMLSICGGVFIFLMLSLGLCCAFQWKKLSEKKVPDPGHSSLVSWFSQSHHKMAQSFIYAFESQTIYEMVYPCGLHAATHCLTQITTETNDYPKMKPTSDQQVLSNSSFNGGGSSESVDSDLVEEKTDIDNPGNDPSPLPPKKKPATHEDMSSSEEVTLLPTSESLHLNPYRSQNSVNSVVLSKSEGCKPMLAQRQQNKTIGLTVYVSVDMFEQGQRE